MGFSLGDMSLRHGLMLAPMAGFSDRGMRVVCHKAGAEYSVSEMISAKAVTYGDKKTFALAGIREDEGPVGLQIFGSEPGIMARAAEILAPGLDKEGYVPPRAIDINMGCPVHKIFSNGEGSALMRDPELIYRIVRAVKGATDLPVSVKLRKGVDGEHINAVECAQAAESGGASMICLHGRTRVEMYSGAADWDIIKDVKKCLHIPLVANGDIKTAADALAVIERTGADGIAIGRGAVGNPFLFSEIIRAHQGEPQPNIGIRERIEAALCQLRISVSDKGERIAVPEARKQIALYLHTFRGAAAIRKEINLAQTYSEVERILMSVLEDPIEENS